MSASKAACDNFKQFTRVIEVSKDICFFFSLHRYYALTVGQWLVLALDFLLFPTKVAFVCCFPIEIANFSFTFQTLDLRIIKLKDNSERLQNEYPAETPQIQNQIYEVESQWSDVKAQVEDTKQVLDKNVRYFELVEEVRYVVLKHLTLTAKCCFIHIVSSFFDIKLNQF